MPSSTQGSRRSPLGIFYLVLGVTLVGGAGLLGWQLERGAERLPPPVDLGLSPEELDRVKGISIGRPDAPVVIREFADFQCPACGLFAQSITPRIKERYVRTGAVRYVHYDFPLTSTHPKALPAALAARCAHEQGRFWEYHDLLYREQGKWSAAKDPDRLFEEYGIRLGLDGSALRSCLASSRHRNALEESVGFGESLGVRATPTLLLNGKRLPEALSVLQLERLIQKELEARK
ncbi:MAG TPA: thioredoxin domain-containing protein [Longimicrobiaceae bacterium]|nr:thioredoxin domain-containing protein [Longimicrobiaceae bacterium]